MSKDLLAGGWAKVLGDDPKKLDMFFDGMLDGFAYHKIVVDKAGKPVDYVFLEVNHAFEEMTRLKREEIIGKKVTSVLPGIENDPANWIGVYGKVALTGKPFQFENHAKPLARWYKVSAYSPEKGHFVALFEDITERKKAEKELKKAREQSEFERKRLETILETTPSAVVIIDAHTGKFSYVNKRAMQLYGFDTLGLSLDENVAKVKARRADGTDYPIDEMPVSRSLSLGQEVRNEEMIIERADGQAFPIIASTAPLHDMQGNITAAIVVFEDITERKKAEETLKKSQEIDYARRMELEALMETVPATIWITHDPECLNMVGNKATYELLHMQPSTNVSETAPQEKRPTSFLAYDSQGKPIPTDDLPMQKVARTGKPVFNSEFEFRFADGRSVWVYGNVMPLRGAKGNLQGAVGAYVDITQIKQMQTKLEDYGKNLEKLVEERTKQLELTSAYARNLLEASLDPLVTINKEGKITDVNKATENVTGCSREEMIGSDFSNYFTKPDEARAGYKKVFTEGLVKDYPLAIRHTCGKITQVLYNATVYTNDSGEIQGVFAAARDVTELNEAEQQAREAAKKLKDSERLAAIGATAGMVGHDIRNPLQAITSDIYLAKTELATLPENEQKINALESLEEIEHNIDYINKIVADLQDYARPLNPRAQETDVESIFNEVLGKNGIPKNIKVSVDIEDKSKKIMADPDYLKRIAANLTLNAVQAMPNGGKLTIRAYVDEQTNDILITFRDTGVGIPEDIKPKLFNPMMTTKSKGQGFGLAVVKRMTEGLGGTVAFKSAEGKGTTFIVRLPPKRAKR